MKPFTFPKHLPSLIFQPIRYRPNGIGYWSGHIPFACDLIASLRPKCLVELGTHMGESYFAFCQAIRETAIECEAFAVDTWNGDVHTGAYDDVVFEEVTAHNAEHYSAFSRLLRMTFDEAASRFDDTSIDLLHIDGAHTYEAVRHDFSTWWPKVRPGGTVIVHDSFERQETFGVWRFLTELKAEGIPVSEFFHSHGLGVVVKPPLDDAEDNLATAFVKAQNGDLREMRRYYEVCAGALHNQFLIDKQQRPADWEITSQVFWRTEGESFREEASVRVAHVIGSQPSDVTLRIPPRSLPYVAVRAVLTLVPALVELFDIRITDNYGSNILGFSKPAGYLFLGPPQESEIDFDLDPTAGEVLSEGGAVRITLAGIDPMKITGRLAAR